MKNNKLPIYSLTLSLNDYIPKIWRRFWVRGNIKLDQLSFIFFISMGWSGYHLSAFTIKNVWYSDLSLNDDPPSDWIEWGKYSLHDIVKDDLTQFQYMYDFGDSWQMTVQVKKEIKLDSNAPYPICVNGKNAGPPEDVGSYPGFEHFIKVMRNKKHKEYKEMCEWWGDDFFDPSYFSIDEVNVRIQNEEEYKEYTNDKRKFR